VLVSARANTPGRILAKHPMGDYAKFQATVRAAASSHAAATTKRAAFEITNATGGAQIRGATLTVMQYGVVPVFASDERYTVCLDGQDKEVRLALTHNRRQARWHHARIDESIAARRGSLLDLTREDVEHLLGHDPCIASLNALLDHVRLGSRLGDPGANLEWFTSLLRVR